MAAALGGGVAVVIAFAAIAVVVTMNSAGLLPEQGATGEQPVKLGVNKWPGFAYVYVAQEKELFEKNGVDVELVFNEAYLDNQLAFVNGKVDGIFGVYSDTILHNAKGIDTTTVWVADYSVEADSIVGSVGTIPELKGKTVSVEGLDSFSHFFVLQMLEMHGLSEADVRFVDGSAEDVPARLASGEIQAGHTWGRAKSEAISDGYTLLATAGEVPGVVTDVLAFKKQVIEDRPGDVEAIVRSLAEAQAYVQSSPEDAIRIMAENEGMPEEEMKEGISELHLFGVQDNKVAMSAQGTDSRSLYESGRNIAEFYLEKGEITEMPDFESIVDPRFVGRL